MLSLLLSVKDVTAFMHDRCLNTDQSGDRSLWG